MKVEVFIDDPIPPNIGWSYGQLGFAKFGVCVWEYANEYRGPVHWINWRKSVFRPEYPQPVAFHYWFHAGVIGVVTAKAEIRNDVPDILVGTTVVNLLKGVGIPIRAPN